ncbi:hypothetical protein ES708_00721 [subsurface metagenome]
MRTMKINSEKIKKELKRLRVTQEEFADSIGMTRQGFGQILKRKKTTFARLNQIATTLDMDAKDLLL